MLQAVHTLMSAVQSKSTDLEGKISAATSDSQKELKQEDLLTIQFQIGQYNAMLEAASSIAKGTTDMLKPLAQRTS